MNSDARHLVFLTGFGPFHGVPENPTEILMRVLKDWPSNDSNWELHSATVLPTDARRSLPLLQQLHEKANQFSQRRTLFLHFGVDSKASRVRLERVAHNCASFRQPDEGGFQPQDEPIAADRGIEIDLCTRVNVKALSSSFDDEILHVGEDIGRFVCNYV